MKAFGLPGTERALAFAHEWFASENERDNSTGMFAGVRRVDGVGVQYVCGQI